MMTERRAYICCGCPSSGNRLMAAILAKHGVHGKGSTGQLPPHKLPVDHNNVVTLLHNEPELTTAVERCLEHGIQPFMLVMVRDQFPRMNSLTNCGFFEGEGLTVEQKRARVREWFRITFRIIEKYDLPFEVVPLESLIQRPFQGVHELLKAIGIEPIKENRTYQVDDRNTKIYDCNARWYGEEPPHPTRIGHGRELVWWSERGYGYYPVPPRYISIYNEAYYEKYVGYANTERGEKITQARIDLVREHIGTERVIDFGIGCGDFVEQRNDTGARTEGYDINPVALEWLHERGLFFDPWKSMCPNMTFWDSLEHLGDPASIINRITDYAFMCLPIFEGPEHVLESKHFRRDEHFWYFTKDGLINWMETIGFEMLWYGQPEVDLGREDIGTFVFRRR